MPVDEYVVQTQKMTKAVEMTDDNFTRYAILKGLIVIVIVSSFLTAHQHNKAIECHSSRMLVKKIYN